MFLVFLLQLGRKIFNSLSLLCSTSVRHLDHWNLHYLYAIEPLVWAFISHGSLGPVCKFFTGCWHTWFLSFYVHTFYFNQGMERCGRRPSHAHPSKSLLAQLANS